MEQRVRILVVDDHPVVRWGIRVCLAQQHHLEVVGEAASGIEALAKAKELRPDLVLLDVMLPGMDGFAVTNLLRQDLPQTKVLTLSTNDDAETALRSLQCGSRGHLSKKASPSLLLEAIEKVNAGQVVLSPEVATVVLRRMRTETEAPQHAPKLSERQRQVLALLAEGLGNKEIANVLKLSPRTIETHREEVARKLGIRTVAGLTRFALAQGLATLARGAE